MSPFSLSIPTVAGSDCSGTPNALSWKSFSYFRRGRWPPASALSSGYPTACPQVKR